MFSMLLAGFAIQAGISMAADPNSVTPVGSGTELTLDAVTQAVLVNNPEIQEATKKWYAMRARIPQESAWDDPTLSVEAKTYRAVDVPANSFMDQTMSLQQLIPVSGKNLSRARAAAAEALAALEEVRRRELDAVTKARIAYFRLLDAYGQLELNNKNIASLRQISDVIRSKYAVGTGQAADTIVAETETSKLEEMQGDLERSVSDEQSELNVLMDRDAFAPLGPPAPVAVKPLGLSIDELREWTLTNRPEVRMAQDKIDAEEARLQLARRDWVPDPALAVSTQRYNESQQAVSEIDVGISIGLPWFNYGKYSAKAREASDTVGAARQALDGAKAEAIGLLRDQLRKIEAFHHHVELFNDKIIPQAQQAFDATQFAYEAGKADFSDWITTERNLRELQATALDHRTEYDIAIEELKAVIGTELIASSPTSAQPKRQKK